uniref:G-protein coupled receptors family 1 profile domain-containing protein n=1 Tax=Meloidogyne floridensis TaxID=298350 RepID=A0A915NYF4_9BILA
MILLNAAYFHIICLALNRFHAVFFPFNYQIVWKPSNIKYFILVTWLITFAWSALQFTEFTLGIDNAGILYFIKSFLQNGILMNGDIPLLLAVFIATPLYTAVLAQFIFDYRKKKSTSTQNNNMPKDRIIILSICLISLIPCPLLLGLYKLAGITVIIQDTLPSIIINIFYNVCYTLIQFIEEISLFIISKDFRKLVKEQFFKSNGQINNNNKVVNNQVIVVQTISQQQRRNNQINKQN